ncbi:MAG TPA: c-type cytochrome [Burkholderiales bacterium]|nr:c-type cytochrome [Burkholderiales bacterium]
MKPTLIGACCAIALVAAAQAQAQDARGMAATCFTCHGNEGRSVGGVPPSLAGRPKAELLQAMKDFQDGKRSATIMHQHAKGYSDAELDLITGYFAGVKPGAASPAPAAR